MSVLVALVVDDEPDLLMIISKVVRKFGFEVHTASGGTEALEVLSKHKVDIVISDVRMPDGDGIELLEKIRRKDPKIPVVFLITGFADITPDEAIKKGAQVVLPKPFSVQQLHETIGKYLSLDPQ